MQRYKTSMTNHMVVIYLWPHRLADIGRRGPPRVPIAPTTQSASMRCAARASRWRS